MILLSLDAFIIDWYDMLSLAFIIDWYDMLSLAFIIDWYDMLSLAFIIDWYDMLSLDAFIIDWYDMLSLDAFYKTMQCILIKRKGFRERGVHGEVLTPGRWQCCIMYNTIQHL